MGGTTVPKKLYYRIGEACRAVDIQPYVLRYWETEFDALAPGKSKSGQRVYTEQELGVIRRIKELLYEEGYTIAGAKKRLQSELEEGRSFASPEVDGELFEGGEGEAAEGGEVEDDTPIVAAESAPEDAESGASDAAPPSATEPEPAFAAVDAPAAEDTSAPEPPAKVETPRRSRSRAKREIAASPSAKAVAEGAAETSVDSAASAVAMASPARSAVDSPLTDRVETLEHGLRRVLAEVRHLRGLLADSDSGR